MDRNPVVAGFLIMIGGSLSARRAWIEITYVTRLPRCQVSLSARRAWIEISIDDLEPSTTRRSLSARRAWIEIALPSIARYLLDVALRKESVDRNIPRGQLPTPEPPSLSARRAWIEIVLPGLAKRLKTVALRKESVDRNIACALCVKLVVCRSPQGERG